MDTKFSVALHILVMIAESDRTLSSKGPSVSAPTPAIFARSSVS